MKRIIIIIIHGDSGERNGEQKIKSQMNKK
jgi:hypothetical protein